MLLDNAAQETPHRHHCSQRAPWGSHFFEEGHVECQQLPSAKSMQRYNVRNVFEREASRNSFRGRRTTAIC